MSQLVNLTPHALHIFAADTPDRINPAEHTPIRTIPVSDQIARLGVNELGSFPLDGLTVTQLEHQGSTGLPPYAGHMDSRDREIWYIVSLVTALAARDRGDLLVVHGDVRNLGGHVVGCRGFGKPV